MDEKTNEELFNILVKRYNLEKNINYKNKFNWKKFKWYKSDEIYQIYYNYRGNLVITTFFLTDCYIEDVLKYDRVNFLYEMQRMINKIKELENILTLEYKIIKGL